MVQPIDITNYPVKIGGKLVGVKTVIPKCIK